MSTSASPALPGGHIRRKRRRTTIAVIGGRDREAFPEFYGEYDSRVLANARAAGRAIVTGRAQRLAWIPVQRVLASLGERQTMVVNSVFSGRRMEDVWLDHLSLKVGDYRCSDTT